MQLSRAALIQNKGNYKDESASYKIHIFSCTIILVNHVSYSDIHVYIRSIINNFHLPRAFSWCGALPSDCEIYTALHSQ